MWSCTGGGGQRRRQQLKTVLYRSQGLEIHHPWFSWMLVADLLRPVLELPGDLFDLTINRFNIASSPLMAAALTGAFPAATLAKDGVMRTEEAFSATRLTDMPGGPAEVSAVRLLLGPSELFRYGAGSARGDGGRAGRGRSLTTA